MRRSGKASVPDHALTAVLASLLLVSAFFNWYLWPSTDPDGEEMGDGPAGGSGNSGTPKALAPRIISSSLVPPPCNEETRLVPAEVIEPPGRRFDRQARDARWAGPTERLLEELLSRIAEAYGAEAAIDVQCRTSCCRVHVTGEATSGFPPNLGEGLGPEAWAESAAFSSDGSILCFPPSGELPPEDYTDRIDEVSALRLRAAPSIRTCRGRADAPGHITLEVEVDPDGKVSNISVGGDLNGSDAAACVEDAIQDAAEFLPGPSSTTFALSYHLEPE